MVSLKILYWKAKKAKLFVIPDKSEYRQLLIILELSFTKQS